MRDLFTWHDLHLNWDGNLGEGVSFTGAYSWEQHPEKERRWQDCAVGEVKLPYSTRASQVTLVVKNLPANSGGKRHASLIPGLGRSPGRRQGNPCQYSCLEDPMDRGAWWTIVHGVEKSRTGWKRLSRHTQHWQGAQLALQGTLELVWPFRDTPQNQQGGQVSILQQLTLIGCGLPWGRDLTLGKGTSFGWGQFPERYSALKHQ